MLFSCSIAVLHCDAVSGEGIRIKRDVILLAGKMCQLEESIPIIVGMLKSQNKEEQLAGLEAVRDWGWQLQGTDLVVQTIDLFNGSRDRVLKGTALGALCAVGDGRATEVFEQAAAYEDEFFKFGGLIGLADQHGPELVPRLIHAMVNSQARVLTDSAWVMVSELVGSDFCWPAKEVWKSESAKREYLREFDLWWQQKKDRLIAEWKAQRASDAKIPPQKESRTSTPSIATPLTTAAPYHKAVKKMQNSEQNVEELSARDSQRKSKIVKLIAFSAAGFAVLGSLLWLVLKKQK
jgi:hypothetical protein